MLNIINWIKTYKHAIISMFQSKSNFWKPCFNEISKLKIIHVNKLWKVITNVTRTLFKDKKKLYRNYYVFRLDHSLTCLINYIDLILKLTETNYMSFHKECGINSIACLHVPHTVKHKNELELLEWARNTYARFYVSDFLK